MIDSYLIGTLAVTYLCTLFLIAWFGDFWLRKLAVERRPAADLCAFHRRLLHLLDLLRQRRLGLVDRLRLPRRLHRPDPDVHARLAADHAHRAAGESAEHHIGG